MSDPVVKTKSGRSKVSVRRAHSNDYDVYATDRQLIPYFYGDKLGGRWFDVNLFLSHLADYREMGLVRTVKLDGARVVRVQSSANDQTENKRFASIAQQRIKHIAERARMLAIGKAKRVE